MCSGSGSRRPRAPSSGCRCWARSSSAASHDILHLLRRRPPRLRGGDRGDLPADGRADLRRPPDPAQPHVRSAARARPGRPRPEADLHRRRRRRRPGSARGLRRQMGIALPRDHAAWSNAWEFVTPSCLPARGPSRDLLDKRDRSAHPTAAKRSRRRTLPHRAGRQETDLSRHHQRRTGVDANPNWTTALLAFKSHRSKPALNTFAYTGRTPSTTTSSTHGPTSS